MDCLTDCAHVLHRLALAQIIARSNDIIFVQITLLAGRDAATKQAFYARVVELLKQKPGVRPEDVVINLMEDKPEDWSFGNGVGQYMVLPREKWK